jgi:hypothetical protein
MTCLTGTFTTSGSFGICCPVASCYYGTKCSGGSIYYDRTNFVSNWYAPILTQLSLFQALTISKQYRHWPRLLLHRKPLPNFRRPKPATHVQLRIQLAGNLQNRRHQSLHLHFRLRYHNHHLLPFVRQHLFLRDSKRYILWCRSRRRRVRTDQIRWEPGGTHCGRNDRGDCGDCFGGHCDFACDSIFEEENDSYYRTQRTTSVGQWAAGVRGAL